MPSATLPLPSLFPETKSQAYEFVLKVQPFGLCFEKAGLLVLLV
jgi:hypothetical protein